MGGLRTPTHSLRLPLGPPRAEAARSSSAEAGCHPPKIICLFGLCAGALAHVSMVVQQVVQGQAILWDDEAGFEYRLINKPALAECALVVFVL